MVVFALYNLKGGVGKTSSCVNLAYLAAKDGFSTLLWDMDPQGSASFYCNSQQKMKGSIKKILTADAIGRAIAPTDYENLDIIAADESAKSMNTMLEEMSASKKKLKQVLQPLDGVYDFVFLDCPPGLSSLAENIFSAADFVVLPIIPTPLSIRTLDMVNVFFQEKKLDASKLKCFFSMADLRKPLHTEQMDDLGKSKQFFKSYIPYLADIEKMGVYESPVAIFAPKSQAAKFYQKLWEEIKDTNLDIRES